MKKLKLNVTQKDIDKAIKILADKSKFPSVYCPIALSLHRHKDFKTARVFKYHILDNNTRISLPSNISAWISTSITKDLIK